MTATFTSTNLAIRVEVPDEGGCVVFSADHGGTWQAMSSDEARSLAAGLCVAAERLDERENERERAA